MFTKVHAYLLLITTYIINYRVYSIVYFYLYFKVQNPIIILILWLVSQIPILIIASNLYPGQTFPHYFTASADASLYLVMKQSFVDISGIPTLVTTWGGHIGEKLDSKEIILCIPGNPGISEYYYSFLEILHNRLEIPVWIIGHTGHEEPEDEEILKKIPQLKGNETIYNTFGQIDHKVRRLCFILFFSRKSHLFQAEFIRKYVPSDVKIHMVGHSIGTFVILQLLKQDDIKSRIKSSSMLFPTIYNLLYTPLGLFCVYFVKPILPLVIFVSFIFSILPTFLATFLTYLYFTIISVPRKHIKQHLLPTIRMIKPSIIKKVFHLGFDEIMTIKELESEVINENADRMKFYFGTTDLWVPTHHYEKVKTSCPKADAQLCERNFNHAFVLKYPEEVGEMVGNWIIDWNKNK